MVVCPAGNVEKTIMKYQNLNRRDFLKLLLLLPLAAKRSGLSSLLKSPITSASSDQPNIFIFLFDTLSARNVSLYGYPRETMPNLARFAEQATVYHQHHAGGNWTPSGTASLLTGTYPWSNRCQTIYSKVLQQYADKNIFSLTRGKLNSLTYTQNFLVETLLNQFRDQIDLRLDMRAGGVISYRPEGQIFKNDYTTNHWASNLIEGTWEFPASSPFLSILNEIYYSIKYRGLLQKYKNEYPYGLVNILPGVFVLLDEISALVQTQLQDPNLPTLSYYHFFPPHHPYRPRKDFINLFDDDWQPPLKPTHTFTDGTSQEVLISERRLYDQFIANVDDQFGLILNELENNGLLENSYVIFTSDHGESLERGIWRHTTQVLYEPLTHIPLLIHKPGQTSREDIYTPTSSVDILPTICQITGQPVPAWIEGQVLPGFPGATPDPQRPIFSVEAKENNKFGPLTIATIAMIQWPYKLIHYFGYEELPHHFELYNLAEDPEELDDLYPAGLAIANALESQLLAKLEEVNQTTGGAS
jgi:arylsulfatase A-like enzyme